MKTILASLLAFALASSAFAGGLSEADSQSSSVAGAGASSGAGASVLIDSHAVTTNTADIPKSPVFSPASLMLNSCQEGSTNKYFTGIRVLATLMAGFTLVAGGTVLAADSLLAAVGKLQKQINDLFSGKQDTLVSGTTLKTVNGSTLLGSGDLVVSGGASLPAVQTFTGPKTLALADINTYNVSQDATAQAVALPAQATVAWTDDAEIHIERGAAGAVTIVGAAGVQINGTTAGTFTMGGQYSVVTLKRKASNLWTLFGNAS